VGLASVLSYRLRIPFTYYEVRTGRVDSTPDIRGKRVVLILDKIVDKRAIELTIKAVKRQGGRLDTALLHGSKSDEAEVLLTGMGITKVTEIP
jgi:uncharacterized protein YacL